jgi:hypothetical protein
MSKPPTFLTAVVIPLAGALISGLLAGLLALAMGGNGWAIGLAAALAAWLLRPGALPHLPELPAGKKEQSIRVDIISEAGRVGDFVHLAIDPGRLRDFAQGLTQGRALTCREWTGRGGLFSQSEFSRLRSHLIRQGLARWVSDRDPRGGCILTAKGKATFTGLAALPQVEQPGQEKREAWSVKHTHTATQKGLSK